MNVPEELKYTKEHEWIRVEGDEAVIGITDFAQSELGDIVFIDVDTEGQEVELDAIFGSIEAVKTVSDLFMPVKGTVLSVNEKLADDPALVNTDAFGEGWMVRIKIDDLASIETLMTAAEYVEMYG